MSELSKNTKQLVHALYQSREALEICDILETECDAEVLSCKDWSPSQMERIRFSVLKVAKENLMSLDSAVDLAKRDWRDLLVLAGFSTDLGAHETWANSKLR